MNPSGGSMSQVLPVDDLVDGLAGIKKTVFKAVVAVFFALAILSVLVRGGACLRTRRAPALDDYLLSSAAILLIGGTGFLYSICDNLYLLSAIQLDPSIPSRLGSPGVTGLIDAVQGYRSFLAIIWTAIFLVKLSFLAFFRSRTGKALGISGYYWTAIALTTISWLLCVIEPFIVCPNPGSGSLCFADSNTTIRSALTGVTTALDLLTIILIAAIPIISALQRQTTPLSNTLNPSPGTEPNLANTSHQTRGAIAVITTLILTTASFSVVRASRAGAADFPQTAFWLALEASTAVLVGMGTMSRSLLHNAGEGSEHARGGEGVDERVETCGHRPRSYYSVWDRVKRGFGARGNGVSKSAAREGDVEAGGARETTKIGKEAMKGFGEFAGRIKRQKGTVVTKPSQLDDSIVEEDGVRSIKEKTGVTQEVRQLTSSPAPRNPPIAYHYPMWGPQPTHGTEDEIRAGQDLIWLNPSLQASQTSFGSATLYDRRGSERRGSERRGSERRGSERRGSEPVTHIALVGAANSKM